MMRVRPARNTMVLFALLAIFAAWVVPAFAEGLTKVRGTVVDKDGKPMVKVPIWLEAVTSRRRWGRSGPTRRASTSSPRSTAPSPRSGRSSPSSRIQGRQGDRRHHGLGCDQYPINEVILAPSRSSRRSHSSWSATKDTTSSTSCWPRTPTSSPRCRPSSARSRPRRAVWRPRRRREPPPRRHRRHRPVRPALLLPTPPRRRASHPRWRRCCKRRRAWRMPATTFRPSNSIGPFWRRTRPATRGLLLPRQEPVRDR